MSAIDPTPIVSRVCADGTILETVYDPLAGSTALAIATPDGAVDTAPHFDPPEGGRFVPYSPTNNLLTSGCVLLPSAVGDVGDKRDIVANIRAYLDRYVALSAPFLDLAPYYVLLSWVYDGFQEVPLLRFRGDYGSGKTRALLAIGSICYKPFFASGASTVSPIFHILDTFRGTLILDEADFRFSDMTGEFVKILNNGTVNGLPVLRTMTNRHKELNPTAFRVFGPKILAMRGSFSDPALESRMITEEMTRRPLPAHIPIHTPASLREEALTLRNQLLAWRLRNRATVVPDGSRAIEGVDARTNQMALALLSLVDDPAERTRIASWLTEQSGHRQQSVLATPEALVLAATVNAFERTHTPYIGVADIASRYNQRALATGQVPMSNKWVGVVIRKLGLPTAKSRGVYGISITERTRIALLADRLGIPHQLTADINPSSAATADSTVSNEDA
jgi:hypothetical protein